MKRRFLVRGIRQVVTLRGPAGPRRGDQLADPAVISDGAMLIDHGRFVQVGPTARIENLTEARGAEELPCPGNVVIPCFVDAHTHLLHGPARIEEFEARIREGRPGKGVHANEGVFATMRAVRAAPAARLRTQAVRALRQAASFGSTTVEVKSGYGLDEATETKMLRLLKTLHGHPLSIVPTYLGLHVLPPEFDGRSAEWLDFVLRRQLPLVARRRLAQFADAGADPQSFSLEQIRRFLSAARAHGLGLRLHVPPNAHAGAITLAAELGATSVDGLEAVTSAEMDLLARTSTIAVLLPGRTFHQGSGRFARARSMIEAGTAVALATNFNPGTSPSCSMPFALSLACTQMGMTPGEALAAATINGAHALGIAAEAGSLEHGKWADFVVLDASDYRELPYYFGMNLVAMTVRRGEVVYCREAC